MNNESQPENEAALKSGGMAIKQCLLCFTIV